MSDDGCGNDDERRAIDVLRAVFDCAVDCVDPGGGALALVEDVSKADNLGKLRSADADEAHLFLWVHSDSGAPSAALQLASSEGLVPDPPQLPEGVDASWVAGAWTEPGQVGQLAAVLYRVDSTGWRRVSPMPPAGSRSASSPAEEGQ